MDLLLPPAFKADPPKLEIKKDLKGMVTVAGATIVEVSSRRAHLFNHREFRELVAGHSARNSQLPPNCHVTPNCLLSPRAHRSPVPRSCCRLWRPVSNGATSPPPI